MKGYFYSLKMAVCSLKFNIDFIYLKLINTTKHRLNKNESCLKNFLVKKKRLEASENSSDKSSYFPTDDVPIGREIHLHVQ